MRSIAWNRYKPGRTHRRGDVSTGDALNGRVQVVKGLALDDLGADFRADAECGEAALDGDKARSRSVHDRTSHSSAITYRFVFLTDALIVSMSSGRMLRRLMTSASRPRASRSRSMATR